MRFSAFTASFQKHAPRILGAVFCTAVWLASPACNPKRHSPDWKASPLQPTETTSPAQAPPPLAPPASASNAASAESLRFITYNVENWLRMERHVDHKTVEGASKPASQKLAVIQILAHNTPDVIGLCEIGTPADLAEVQQDLKAAGLSLPHSYFTGGSDPTRHLGLLSRYPITATTHPTETVYQLAGRTFEMNRGILDATIAAPHKTYRFIGAHLKSKRDSQQGNQEDIRLSEARLLRHHVDAILKQDANARLIVYGDFNDTRATPAIQTITGRHNSPSYLTAIPAKDSHHEAWTHYWALNDIYSRIDFIMVSPALRQEVDFSAAKVIDDVGWDQASDHRAVFAIFK